MVDRTIRPISAARTPIWAGLPNSAGRSSLAPMHVLAALSLLRRWVFGPRVDEPLEYESYAGATAPGSGSVTSLFASRLGSVLLAVNVATGTVAMEAEYDAFGARTLVQGTEEAAPRYGYTGREHNAESGLTYYRARHYDPGTGTFLQRDPIGFGSGTTNLYGYVSQNPINLIDPTGLFNDKGGKYRYFTGAGATSQYETQLTTDANLRIAALPPVVVATAGLDSLINLSLVTIAEELAAEAGAPEPEPEPQPQAEGGGSGGRGPIERHHCRPVSYGFDKSQELVSMPRSEHKRLHRLMRQFFRSIVDETGSHMDYGPNRTNADVVRQFGLREVMNRLQEFYDIHPEFGC